MFCDIIYCTVSDENIIHWASEKDNWPVSDNWRYVKRRFLSPLLLHVMAYDDVSMFEDRNDALQIRLNRLWSIVKSSSTRNIFDLVLWSQSSTCNRLAWGQTWACGGREGCSLARAQEAPAARARGATAVPARGRGKPAAWAALPVGCRPCTRMDACRGSVADVATNPIGWTIGWACGFERNG